MGNFSVGDRKIGPNQPVYFIADIGANHDGDLYRAYKLIELAKESGADAAKFQNFKADRIVSEAGFSSLGEQFSHQSKWKKSVFEVYKDASLPSDWPAKLKKKCDEVGIEYFTSVYDFDSVDLVDPYVNIYKIGSGDITWHGIIEYIAKKGKPVIISTGASTLEEVKLALEVLQKRTKEIILNQCNTDYTANEENFKYLNLNVLKLYHKLYPHITLGLSDHTLGYSTVLGAITLGARVIEKHFTDDSDRIGPDHKFATNPKIWKEMVARSRELFFALGDGIKRIEDNEKETAIVQRRGLRFVDSYKRGHIIKSRDLFPLRPREKDGIPPYELYSLIGKKLVKDVNKDGYIRWEDIQFK